MIMLQCGDQRLMLVKTDPTPSSESAPSTLLYFLASNLIEVIGNLKSAGVKIQAEPHSVGKLGEQEVHLAFIRDSENNLIGLISG